jgi:hypothetical protein
MREARADAGCGDSKHESGFVDRVAKSAFRKYESVFGLAFEVALVSWDGYCSEWVRGECGK